MRRILWFKKLGEFCYEEGHPYFGYPVLQMRAGTRATEDTVVEKDD